MKFRKTISCFMVGGLLLSSNTLAFGDSNISTVPIVEEKSFSYNTQSEVIRNENLSETEAIELAKEHIKNFFGETISDIEGFQINTNYSNHWENNDYVWRIDFYKSGTGSYVSYNATIVDVDKSLLEISGYREPTADEPKAAQFTQEEVEKVAIQFLKKFNPEIMKDLILDANYQNQYNYYGTETYGLHPREYYVFYTRHHNGIPVMNQGVQLGINNATGQVTSYRISWNDIDIPKIEATITPEKARELFKDNLDYSLMYIPVRDRSRSYSEEVEGVRLVYVPAFESGLWVDAITGEMLSPNTSHTLKESKRIDLTEKEKEEIKNLSVQTRDTSKEMTREEAIKLTQKTLNTLYKDNVTIQNINYNSSNYYGTVGRRKAWDIQFEVESNYRTTGNINIDAITGEILMLNLHNWRYYDMLMAFGEEFTPEVKWEDAYYTGIEALKQLYPNKLKHLDFEQVYSESTHYYNDRKIINPEYNFNFTQVENDISYSNNSISITIDSSNGLVQRVYYRWNDVELPKPKDTISKEMAMDLYMNQSKVDLGYITRLNNEKNENEVKLVYLNTPKNSLIHNYIDAHSGELVDYMGQSIVAKDGEVRDLNGELEGHWAEKVLKIMSANGVIDFQKVSLGDKMTRNEIVKMMVNSVGNIYYSPNSSDVLKFTDIDVNDEYYQYLEQAIMYGFIDNKEKNFEGYANISREELAELLINMTSLKKAAELQNIYTLPVEDLEEIDEDKLGATALVYGLDIMKGSDNKFRPTENVTLEQAATAIYRAYNLFGRPRW